MFKIFIPSKIIILALFCCSKTLARFDLNDCIKNSEIDVFRYKPDLRKVTPIIDQKYFIKNKANNFYSNKVSLNESLVVRVKRPNFNLVYPIFEIQYALNQLDLREDGDTKSIVNSKQFLIGGKNVFGQGVMSQNTVTAIISKGISTQNRVINLGFVGSNLKVILNKVKVIFKNKVMNGKNFVLLLEDSLLSRNFENDIRIIGDLQKTLGQGRFKIAIDFDVKPKDQKQLITLFKNKKITYVTIPIPKTIIESRYSDFLIPFSHLRSELGHLIIACSLTNLFKPENL